MKVDIIFWGDGTQITLIYFRLAPGVNLRLWEWVAPSYHGTIRTRAAELGPEEWT